MIFAAYTDFDENAEVIRWNTSTSEMMGEPIVLPPVRELCCAAVSSNGGMVITG